MLLKMIQRHEGGKQGPLYCGRSGSGSGSLRSSSTPMSSGAVSVIWSLVLVLLLSSCCCFRSAQAELINFDLILEPTPATIHYTDFYLRGPGTMDLSKLVFESLGGDFAKHLNKTKTKKDKANSTEGEGDDDWEDDDDFNDATDDQQDDVEGPDVDDGEELMHKEGGVDTDTADDDADDNDNNDGGRRRQRQLERRQSRRRRRLAEHPYTTIDVVAFHLPSTCSKSRQGCDWTSLGVGAKHDGDGILRWCCTAEAQKLGLCEANAEGRLIVTPKFKGDKHVLQIDDGDYAHLTDSPKVKELESGKYVLIMASCSDAGRQVLVSGMAGVKSVHGYLPGELYGFMFFYLVLTILYFLLVMGYGVAMIQNEESRIPIEKWILMTIGLGTLEMLFKLGNVYVWNVDGYQAQWIAFVGVIFGVMKRGWSRCLMVMVSLGWGVTRDSLGSKLKFIVLAGVTYVGVSATRDIMLIVAVEDIQELSESFEKGLFDLYTIFTFVVAALDVLFAMWILDSLSTTMEYLEGLKQTRKLKRYLALRCLFLFAVLFAMIWVIFAVVNSMANGIVEEEDAWLVDGATEVNYLIVLMGVAWMWRPNPSAREYAYAMELPSGGMVRDDETGVTELELTGVVPSAMDSDDDMDGEYDDDSDDGITPPSSRNGDRKNGGFRD